MASTPEPRWDPGPGWAPGVAMVPVQDFLDGRLPPVCARTGTPATVNLRRQAWMAVSWAVAGAVPIWLGLALFLEYRVSFALGAGFACLGALVVLVTARRARPIVIGSLPLSAGVARPARRWHALAGDLALAWVAAWLGAIAVTLIAGEGASTLPLQLAFAVAGAALLAGSGVLLLMEARTVGVSARLVRERGGERWVRLRGVHPAFAAAVEARMRGRRGL